MSWRRGLRHCLPSGFPGSYRLFTILEDWAWYTPLVLPGMVAVAGLVLDAVYNGPHDAPHRRKVLARFRALKEFTYEEYWLATSSVGAAEWRTRPYWGFKVTDDDALDYSHELPISIWFIDCENFLPSKLWRSLCCSVDGLLNCIIYY